MSISNNMAATRGLLLMFLSGGILVVSKASVLRAAANNDDAVAQLGVNQTLQGLNNIYDSTDVYTFLGVRYAEAPTGDKRFQPPVPAADWTGVKNATQLGSRCLQNMLPGDDESEDCLFLNVYSPSLKGSLPVMVWIHGGAFHSGSGISMRSNILASMGVVVVSLNYRLGPFGFLSTDDDIMPGNYGLLDQLEALKWVQKNIHAFGGDPSQVTIFGESAGSASVSLQVLSPLSKGLFQRAIMESGAALCLWAVERPTTEVKLSEFASTLGGQLGCANTSVSELAECLRNADAVHLLQSSFGVRLAYGTDMLSTPRVETKFGFLPDYPTNLLDQGTFNDVDILAGFNSGEWTFVMSDPEDDGITIQEFRQTLEGLTQVYRFNDWEKTVTTTEMFYVDNVTDPIELRTQLVNALTDVLFAAPTALEVTKKQRAGSSARHYIYELDYRTSITSTPAWMGVQHANDVTLLNLGEDGAGTATDHEVAEAMHKMWTNFAKTGDPSTHGQNHVNWDEFKVADDSRSVLFIDSPSTLGTLPRDTIVGVYEQVLERFLLEKPDSTVVG